MKKKNLKNIIIGFLVGLCTLAPLSILSNIDINKSNSSLDNNVPTKNLCCIYDESLSFESAKGGLRIFCPTENGYVNYNILHTIDSSRYSDVWRIGQALFFDDNLSNSYPISVQGAEWDMALKIDGRNDFIGGYAHGDESYTSVSFTIDGKEVDVTTINELIDFEEIIINESSIGYDPNDHITEALYHDKEFVITKDGIKLNQRVQWLNEYKIMSSYLAMMPPLKSLTDHFYTDTLNEPLLCSSNMGTFNNAKEAVVYGEESGLYFEMSVPNYPSLKTGNYFLLADNGGGAYNKMYFVLCNGYNVSPNEVWESTTIYKIYNKG